MGSTSRGNARMMVSVVMSSATRVPFTSFSLSSFVRTPTTYRGPEEAFTMTARRASRRVVGLSCEVRVENNTVDVRGEEGMWALDVSDGDRRAKDLSFAVARCRLVFDGTIRRFR